jgi:hypothetical protein
MADRWDGYVDKKRKLARNRTLYSPGHRQPLTNIYPGSHRSHTFSVA